MSDISDVQQRLAFIFQSSVTGSVKTQESSGALNRIQEGSEGPRHGTNTQIYTHYSEPTGAWHHKAVPTTVSKACILGHASTSIHVSTVHRYKKTAEWPTKPPTSHQKSDGSQLKEHRVMFVAVGTMESVGTSLWVHLWDTKQVMCSEYHKHIMVCVVLVFLKLLPCEDFSKQRNGNMN